MKKFSYEMAKAITEARKIIGTKEEDRTKGVMTMNHCRIFPAPERPLAVFMAKAVGMEPKEYERFIEAMGARNESHRQAIVLDHEIRTGAREEDKRVSLTVQDYLDYLKAEKAKAKAKASKARKTIEKAELPEEAKRLVLMTGHDRFPDKGRKSGIVGSWNGKDPEAYTAKKTLLVGKTTWTFEDSEPCEPGYVVLSRVETRKVGDVCSTLENGYATYLGVDKGGKHWARRVFTWFDLSQLKDLTRNQETKMTEVDMVDLDSKVAKAKEIMGKLKAKAEKKEETKTALAPALARLAIALTVYEREAGHFAKVQNAVNRTRMVGAVSLLVKMAIQEAKASVQHKAKEAEYKAPGQYTGWADTSRPLAKVDTATARPMALA